jgi:hypothetical protein
MIRGSQWHKSVIASEHSVKTSAEVSSIPPTRLTLGGTRYHDCTVDSRAFIAQIAHTMREQPVYRLQDQAEGLPRAKEGCAAYEQPAAE